MAIHVLSFLVSLSLFTGMALTEQGSILFWVYTIALIAFHRGAGIYEGQMREREEKEERYGDGLKEVRAAIEKQKELYNQLQSMEIKDGNL
jgi:hypothetical protein